MESVNFDESTTLSLTAHSFELLLNAVLDRFSSKYEGATRYGLSQIFGFGNYNESLPNLKSELQQNAATFINGKYLYDKKRELQSGKPYIKLTRPYKHLLFAYLGYNDVISFIDDRISDPEEKQKQLNLLSINQKDEPFYYVSYHYGEYREIVKAQVIVRDNWKTVEYKYLYPQSDGSSKEFVYIGNIKKRADALHIQTKTLMDGKMVESGENILYVGYGDPGSSKFILGVFSAFDINNRLIACKIIHEKADSKEDMIALSKAKKIPAYIAQEIRNQRIENDINIPNNKLEISKKSPYYHTYEKVTGKYKFAFYENDDEIGTLDISIDPNSYKIKSSDPGILINKDEIDLLQNGSVLHFSFQMTGLSSFTQLQIFVKTYYLNDHAEKIKGVYSGIDLENRLRSGKVMINYKSEGTTTTA